MQKHLKLIFNKEILQRMSLLCQRLIKKKNLNFYYELHGEDTCNYFNYLLKTRLLIL